LAGARKMGTMNSVDVAEVLAGRRVEMLKMDNAGTGK